MIRHLLINLCAAVCCALTLVLCGRYVSGACALTFYWFTLPGAMAVGALLAECFQSGGRARLWIIMALSPGVLLAPWWFFMMHSQGAGLSAGATLSVFGIIPSWIGSCFGVGIRKRWMKREAESTPVRQ